MSWRIQFVGRSETRRRRGRPVGYSTHHSVVVHALFGASALGPRSAANHRRLSERMRGMPTHVARSLRAWARLAVWLLVVTPSAAHAQSTFTGVVKDTSGAVLPGVTVEAASPVLIEKTRSAVTDSTGSYRIVDLRPGVYSLSFTLAGFSIVKRENIELLANFTMTINGEMKVGGIEET